MSHEHVIVLSSDSDEEAEQAEVGGAFAVVFCMFLRSHRLLAEARARRPSSFIFFLLLVLCGPFPRELDFKKSHRQHKNQTEASLESSDRENTKRERSFALGINHAPRLRTFSVVFSRSLRSRSVWK